MKKGGKGFQLSNLTEGYSFLFTFINEMSVFQEHHEHLMMFSDISVSIGCLHPMPVTEVTAEGTFIEAQQSP